MISELIEKLKNSEEKLKNSEEKLKITDGTKYCDVLRIVAFMSLFVMVAVQIILLLTFSGEQITDSKVYLNLAKECAENNWWYPAKSHLSLKYFFGVGLVNLIAFVLKITNNIKVLFVMNILYVQVILWSCVYIAKKLFNRKTICYWVMILFCLLNTFWSEIVQLRTEALFTALVFLGWAILLSSKKWSYIIAGIIFALANWVRPIAIVFIAGALLQMICKRKNIRQILMVVASYAVVIGIIGTISYMSCGHFIYKSTTFGYNLLMSANDDADGSFMNVFEVGEVGYLSPTEREGMIFKDYNEYYTNLSLEWIKKNPMGYIKQIPAKLFYLYATETYSGSSYFNNERDTSGIKYIKSVADKFTGNSDEPIMVGDVLVCFNQLWYMMIFVMFIIGVMFLVTKKMWWKMVPFWLSMLGGTGVTILVVGGARYHFPYLPIMIMCAAFAYECIFTQSKKIEKRK